MHENLYKSDSETYILRERNEIHVLYKGVIGWVCILYNINLRYQTRIALWCNNTRASDD